VSPDATSGARWQHVATQLFPQGHSIRADGPILAGTGTLENRTLAVIGTHGSPEIGVEVAFAIADRVLQVVSEYPSRPLLLLIDTQGQRLRRREELFCLNRYMGHLAACIEFARQRGHAVLALVYEQALSGGFLASAMMADHCAALPDADIRVMSLPAMARVTRIPLERLTALAAESSVFAPGAASFLRMGGLDAIWDGDLSASLAAALAQIRCTRELASAITQRVIDSELPREW